ncbi:hypothetical protein CARUB_v10002537mg [Capsella rubella]|uniref:F-box domain-containing protein n=1 Tax=Capsella rubella TaxID=81985 RepID=R0GYQ2_9BRAS|nr:probable F-box protein At5g47300 [Capsella rubella]EOA22014.1 hypothetical protein CARUB_v10002537mg [Capsella rubella]
MTMSELPGDVVEEILCYVPATSLKRLRSTCKRWNLLLDDARFARKHFDKAARHILIIMLTEEYSRVCLMNINLHGFSSIGVIGELSLINSHPSLRIADISKAFHYDGLLLCTIKDSTSLVVWNPCTGQTIQTTVPYKTVYSTFALGSYKDKNSGYNNSYKILCYYQLKEFAIYEIKTNSWKTLDVALDFRLIYIDYKVSLKGKTYWFAEDNGENHQKALFLASFDYSTEIFGRMCLPCYCSSFSLWNIALSVVKEEKLSMLLQHENTSRTEIWVTNKIDETNVVSWSIFLVVDSSKIYINYGVRFLVEEEKKFVVCWHRKVHELKEEYMIITEGDNKVMEVDFEASTMSSCMSPLLTYVPSLVQIQ